jgi:hypothetical protein
MAFAASRAKVFQAKNHDAGRPADVESSAAAGETEPQPAERLPA